MTIRKRVLRLIAVVLCLAYCCGYVFFRRQHQIVHHVAVAGDRYSQHTVEAGDALFVGAVFNGYVALFYTPLRYLELGFWLLYHPVGSPVPTPAA